MQCYFYFFFSSRRRHTRCSRDWSSDVCSSDLDRSPRWSPDGRRIAFVRLPGTGGAPDSLLPPRPNPWEIWTADATTGAAERLWKSPETLAGSIPTTDGSTNLGWGGARTTALSSF